MKHPVMTHPSSESKSHYVRLLVMSLSSFIAMYVLMYAMVDRFANAYANVNQAYMAGLMAAPMVLIELAVMRGMYPSRSRNLAIAAASTIIAVLCFVGIRTQAGVTDKQFIRSMIPHHASAILMCERASLTDPQLQVLCDRIRSGQQAEIEEMKARLRALD